MSYHTSIYDLFADPELDLLDVEEVRSARARIGIRAALAAAQSGHEGDATEYLARAYCARLGHKRGNVPALDLIDLLAPTAADVEVPPLVAAAVQVVRQRELEEMLIETALRARIQLDPEAWERFLNIIGE